MTSGNLAKYANTIKPLQENNYFSRLKVRKCRVFLALTDSLFDCKYVPNDIHCLNRLHS